MAAVASSNEENSKKGEFRKGGSFEKGALKRSDNPDVIYGRDFEEEAMKIEELIGDMGK